VHPPELLSLPHVYVSSLVQVDYSSFIISTVNLNGGTLMQVMPKQPGFEKRKDLYLLYHYLNHYNLFGSGYRSSAMSIIEDYLWMLGV
jgi:hypothetical protein